MARIIPWKLPDVKGGSVGGYTPAPTPEPLTNYPYNLDDFSISVEIKGNSGKYSSYTYAGAYGLITVSGVEILDATEVSSVIASVSLSAGYVEFTGADSTVVNNKIKWSSTETFDVEIGSIMQPSVGTVEIANKINNNPTPKVKAFREDYGSNKFEGSIGGTALYPATVTGGTATIEITAVTVYNSNGIPLQTWEPGE